MTPKVDMGQNKTIEVTQCFFLKLHFLMQHQIVFLLRNSIPTRHEILTA